MSIISAYQTVGTYRGAAALCGTTHKTVKRVIERFEAEQAGFTPAARTVRRHNFEDVAALVAEKVAASTGRITAKRLLPIVRAAGYAGSDRNFRRLVAAAKKDWRGEHHRGRRPGVWSPREHLVIDWGAIGGVHVFVAVLAWSRWRFVRFAVDEKAATTFAMLAECFAPARWRREGGAGRPDGLPQGWRCCEPGCPDTGLRPFRYPLPVPPGLL